MAPTCSPRTRQKDTLLGRVDSSAICAGHALCYPQRTSSAQGAISSAGKTPAYLPQLSPASISKAVLCTNPRDPASAAPTAARRTRRAATSPRLSSSSSPVSSCWDPRPCTATSLSANLSETSSYIPSSFPSSKSTTRFHQSKKATPEQSERNTSRLQQPSCSATTAPNRMQRLNLHRKPQILKRNHHHSCIEKITCDPPSPFETPSSSLRNTDRMPLSRNNSRI